MLPVSLPAWGAWVGISIGSCLGIQPLVAPRMGSVGWNYDKPIALEARDIVAPRMGSVGWNPMCLLAQGVRVASLPAWGAWVGIAHSAVVIGDA